MQKLEDGEECFETLYSGHDCSVFLSVQFYLRLPDKNSETAGFILFPCHSPYSSSPMIRIPPHT